MTPEAERRQSTSRIGRSQVRSEVASTSGRCRSVVNNGRSLENNLCLEDMLLTCRSLHVWRFKYTPATEPLGEEQSGVEAQSSEISGVEAKLRCRRGARTEFGAEQWHQ